MTAPQPIVALLETLNEFDFELGGNEMATATVEAPQTRMPQIVQKPAKIIPVKLGWMGDQGAGKTSSAGLASVALSKLYHGGAPVWVTDPELGWQFLRPVIFGVEGVELVQRTVPTFQAMLQDLKAAEKAGACVWNVELGKIWVEIIKSLQRAKPDNWGMELVSMWNDFIAQFLSSPLHCMVLGRIQDIVEQVMTESGRIQSVKVGEGMKAGGQKNNFGYEPHLVVRMNLEQRPRVKKGKTFEEEGRMIHRAHISKDRTWALNGHVFRWPDRDGYRLGDYKYVWGDLQPHYLATQKTGEAVRLDTSASSDGMLDHEGNSEYYRNQQRKEVFRGELKATIEALWGGSTQAAKDIRRQVNEHVFGWKSNEAVDAQNLEKIERGVRIMQAFEKRCKQDAAILGSSDENILAHLDIDIREFDEGKAEEMELPF